MTDERRVFIEQTIADLEADGTTTWTTHQVHGLVGGSYPDLVRFLRERRAGTTPASPEAAPARVATQAEPDPSTAVVAVLEPSAPSVSPELAAAQARHAERKARSLAKYRALQAAAPAPRLVSPTPPLRVDPPSIHAKGPDPIILGATAPDTRPKLVRARAEVERYQQLVEHASRQAQPLADQIARCRARQTQLTTDRKTVATVEALRAIKAELVAIDEELEILQRQYAPLAQVARSVSDSLRQASEAYAAVREQARDALDRARSQHFHGQNEGDKARLFRQLTALVGPEDLKQYVTDLTSEAQCRYRRHTPLWRGHQHGMLD